MENQKLKLKIPNSLLIEIFGAISSRNFIKQLKEYARNNLIKFLTENWSNETVISIVDKLREQSEINRKTCLDIPLIEKEDKEKGLLIESTSINIFWRIDNNDKTSKNLLEALFYELWTQAYQSGQLKTHAFDEVKAALNHWRFFQYIKVCTYALSTPEQQNQFLKASIHGDLSQYTVDNFNSSHKYEKDNYQNIAQVLQEHNLEDILYLIDDPRSARVAIDSGMKAMIVIRSGNKEYSEQELNDLNKIHSFDDLIFDKK